MVSIQTRDPKRVEALLKLRQSMLAQGDRQEESSSTLSRPTLNSSIVLKAKALNQSRSVPRISEEEVEEEIKRMEEAGQLQVEMGVLDTFEASMVGSRARHFSCGFTLGCAVSILSCPMSSTSKKTFSTASTLLDVHSMPASDPPAIRLAGHRGGKVRQRKQPQRVGLPRSPQPRRNRGAHPPPYLLPSPPPTVAADITPRATLGPQSSSCQLLIPNSPTPPHAARS